jgi:arylsulfatase A-like enzyme
MADRTKRPHNVLFILTDQERHFDEYPPGVQRPALQRLQAMGTTFTNHYNCSTVCTPSRSNILTGQHIVHTGMFDNTNFPWQDDMSTEIPTMGDRMREAGYYTAYKGKWHLSQDFEQPLEYDAKLLSMEDYGFSDYLGIGDVIGMARARSRRFASAIPVPRRAQRTRADHVPQNERERSRYNGPVAQRSGHRTLGHLELSAVLP